MYRPTLGLALAGASAGSDPLADQQRSPGPCDLLPAAEVAKLLSVPAVQLDSGNAGTNEFTGVELCSWMVDPKDPRGATVKLRRAKSADETEAQLLGRGSTSRSPWTRWSR